MATNHGPRQKHLKPFKVLCVILFNETEYITWNSNKNVKVLLGPLSRSIATPNYRVREYLIWLENNYYIRDLQLNYGNAQFSVNLPSRGSI